MYAEGTESTLHLSILANSKKQYHAEIALKDPPWQIIVNISSPSTYESGCTFCPCLSIEYALNYISWPVFNQRKFTVNWTLYIIMINSTTLSLGMERENKLGNSNMQPSVIVAVRLRVALINNWLMFSRNLERSFHFTSCISNFFPKCRLHNPRKLKILQSG